MNFVFDAASLLIYETRKSMCSKSITNCLFHYIIIIIYSDTSHIAKNIDINTFYINNQFITMTCLNYESLLALIIALFTIMTLLCFLTRLNESFAELITNDDGYNYYQSYYKIIYRYSFICIALTMIISSTCRWIIFESIYRLQKKH